MALIIELDKLITESPGRDILDCLIRRFLRKLDVRKARVGELHFDIGFSVGLETRRRKTTSFLIHKGGLIYLVVLFWGFKGVHIDAFLNVLSMCLSKSIRLIREYIVGFNIYLYRERLNYSMNRNVNSNILIREEIEAIVYEIMRFGYDVRIKGRVILRDLHRVEVWDINDIRNLVFRSKHKVISMIRVMLNSLFIVEFDENIEKALRHLFNVEDENLRRVLLAKIIRAILELIELGKIFIIH